MPPRTPEKGVWLEVFLAHCKRLGLRALRPLDTCSQQHDAPVATTRADAKAPWKKGKAFTVIRLSLRDAARHDSEFAVPAR